MTDEPYGPPGEGIFAQCRKHPGEGVFEPVLDYHDPMKYTHVHLNERGETFLCNGRLDYATVGGRRRPNYTTRPRR